MFPLDLCGVGGIIGPLRPSDQNPMTVLTDLWLWPLDIDETQYQALSRHLGADETGRAASFVFERDRRRFVAGRGRMRELLGALMGQRPGDLRFQYDERGKPRLPAGPPFNLSHSAGWAALAVSPGPAIGIDIEAHRAIERNVAEHFFSRHEVSALRALPAREWQAGFFRCWTRKEAYLKALGTGLWCPLDSFDVTLGPAEAPRILRIDAGADRPGDWTLTHLDLGPGFVGAIALRAAAPVRVVYRDHRPPLHLLG